MPLGYFWKSGSEALSARPALEGLPIRERCDGQRRFAVCRPPPTAFLTAEKGTDYASNFFVNVISAFNTRETGHPAFALSAISSNLAASIPKTLPVKSR
jgi:hypothetical protein